MRWFVLLSLFLSELAPCFAAGSAPTLALPFQEGHEPKLYKEMLAAVEQIPVFDNHAHPGYWNDSDVDAQASVPGMTEILRLRQDNPEFVAAARNLFGYPYADLRPEHAKWLIKKKEELQKQLPNGGYFDRILDKLHIESVNANRVAMPDYLDPKRFHWVPFVDSLLFPFSYDSFYAPYPDDRSFLPMQESKLKREVAMIGEDRLPPDLAGYIAMMTRIITLEHDKGAVAIKFELAYFRPMTFSDPAESAATAIYAKYRAGAHPDYEDYLVFQDYLVRRLFELAGKLGMSVHFHSAIGLGDYFPQVKGNVMNLEPVLNDLRYEKVNFVLLHAGYPDDLKAAWLTTRKNVYIDTSQISEWLYPEQFKEHLKTWLTINPEHVLFGSDAFPYNETVGAEEGYWVSTETARTALAAALAELVGEHALTKEAAIKIAHLYLHDNAVRLYAGYR